MSTRPRQSGRTGSGVRIGIILLAIALVAVVAMITYFATDRNVDETVPDPPETPSTPATSSAPMTETQSEAGGTESPDAEPEPAQTSSNAKEPRTTEAGSPEPAPGQTMAWEGKATFEHFTVEVLRDTGDGEMVEGKAGLPVEVCVVKALDDGDGGGTRISLEPWTLVDSTGDVQLPQTPGAYEPAFPADGTYAVGECAEGYLTFDVVTAEVDWVNLVYENGLGERAVWQFH